MDFDMDFKSLLLSQISIFQLLLRIECTLFLHVDSYHLWEFIFLIKIITTNKKDSVFILPRTFLLYWMVFDVESLLWHIKCAWEDCKDRQIRQRMRIKNLVIRALIQSLEISLPPRFVCPVRSILFYSNIPFSNIHLKQ